MTGIEPMTSRTPGGRCIHSAVAMSNREVMGSIPVGDSDIFSDIFFVCISVTFICIV